MWRVGFKKLSETARNNPNNNEDKRSAISAKELWNDGELVKSPIGRAVGAITIKEHIWQRNQTKQNKTRLKKERSKPLQLLINLVVIAFADKNDD